MNAGMTINELVEKSNAMAREKGFWDGPRNFGEMIALIHSELSEALESHRKNTNDDHLPDLPGWQVELADAMIRIADLGASLNFDLEDVIRRKMEYNASRPRLHGKAY